MSEVPQLLLDHHLKTLKLPTFLREYNKVARQCAAEGLDHVQFLARLVELEMIDRERRMIERRIKAAKFPAVKSLDSVDFTAIPGLNQPWDSSYGKPDRIASPLEIMLAAPIGAASFNNEFGRPNLLGYFRTSQQEAAETGREHV